VFIPALARGLFQRQLVAVVIFGALAALTIWLWILVIRRCGRLDIAADAITFVSGRGVGRWPWIASKAMCSRWAEAAQRSGVTRGTWPSREPRRASRSACSDLAKCAKPAPQKDGISSKTINRRHCGSVVKSSACIGRDLRYGRAGSGQARMSIQSHRWA
jgi:hypothetical protein